MWYLVGQSHHLRKASPQGSLICSKPLFNLTALFCWLLYAPQAHLVLAEGQIHICHRSRKRIMKICTLRIQQAPPHWVLLFSLWGCFCSGTGGFLISLYLYDLTGALNSLSAIKMLYFKCFFFRNIQEIFISFCKKEKTQYISVIFILVMFTHKIPEASYLNCFSIVINVNIRASVPVTEFCFLWLSLIGSNCRNAWLLEKLSCSILIEFLRLWFWTTVNFRMTWQEYSWKFHQLIFYRCDR